MFDIDLLLSPFCWCTAGTLLGEIIERRVLDAHR